MPKTLCNFVPPNRSLSLMKLQYYKLEQRDNIDMKKTRTVYKLKSSGLLSGEDFIGMVAHNKNYSETVVEGVLKDVAHELALMLGNGNNVVVPGIGAFSLGIRLEEARQEQLEDEQSSAGEGLFTSKVKEPNAKHVKLHHINFRIDKKLFKNVESKFRKQTLERVGGRRGVRITIDDMKQSDRIAAAKAFLAEHHFMHVSDYAKITGLSYSSAQRELRELDKYEYTGIKAQGLASHRVYVLSEPKS